MQAWGLSCRLLQPSRNHFCLNAAPALHPLPTVPLEPSAIIVSTENPPQQGILLLEQQHRGGTHQEGVTRNPVATEETTATTESEDQEELPSGNLPNQVPTNMDASRWRNRS
jgi:hypothetical protein